MSRERRILQHIDLETQTGLEIGALCHPIVPPGTPGIRFVDHLPTPELREKYRNDPNVDTAKIVPVTYVWEPGKLAQAVGTERFDYVVASHVAEHVPDLIGWLREVSSVLRPGGILALAIPDKRFTFDCLRETSSFGALLEAYFAGATRPSFAQLVDCFGLKTAGETFRPESLWNGPVPRADVPLATPDFLATFGERGLREHFEAIRDGRYIDVHCWVFTPSSFVATIEQLARLDMIDLAVKDFQDTRPGEIEFYVSLERFAGPPATRSAAIRAALPALDVPMVNAGEPMFARPSGPETTRGERGGRPTRRAWLRRVIRRLFSGRGEIAPPAGRPLRGGR